MEDLQKRIDFFLEVDKMKSIFRKTKLLNGERFENDAEHSFHVAILALILKDYSEIEIDIERVVKMLLLHDLVEIYAGDTYAYDEDAKKSQKDRELMAADKLFSILPKSQGEEFKNLFLEFDAISTNDSLFANSIDRLQPMLLNYYSNGGSWRVHKVSKEQILNRLGPVKKSSSILYDYIFNLISKFFDEGCLIENL